MFYPYRSVWSYDWSLCYAVRMHTKERTINASEFKAKCLRILEELEPQGILITKRGKPIARIVPVGIVDNSRLIGCMRDSIEIRGDIYSTGVKWDAESRHACPDRPPKRRAK